MSPCVVDFCLVLVLVLALARSCTPRACCGAACTQAVLADLQDTFFIDATKMFVTGCSNGGMMDFHIVGSEPGMFRASIPNYALPLRVSTFPVARCWC